jgi:RNA-binding protein 5/10
MPRGVCYLELHTSADSIQLMALISAMDTSFLTDSAPLIINYAKRSSATSVAAAVSTNAASVALAAAQWTNQTSSSSAPATGSLGVVSVNGVTYNKFPKPDPSTFQLESSSGFYYDSTTRLYYDPKSTYYFNSVTQQYLYWSDEYQTYLPPEQTAATAVTADASAKTEKTPDKVKSAKKIAKDMEKWAKTLNQKTVSRVNPEPIITSPLCPSSDHFDDLIASASQVAPEISSEPEVITIDPVAIRREEENKLMDWSKLLCLLCKRQFTSVDQLTKHQQVSDLHRSNLDAKMRSILSLEQMDTLIRRDGQYMDRAGDRRRKWGNNEPVERNVVKEQYLKEMEKSGTSEFQAPITGENKGSKMLKAMGWTEGQGLGKKKSGRTDIIHVEQHVETAGLGARVTVMRSGETYKDAVRRAAAQRYKDLVDE